MYLISLYFDEKTNSRIQYYINQVAKKTGNYFMNEGKVPPHITVSAFEAKSDEIALQTFSSAVSEIQSNNIQFVSTGQFFPNVIFVMPVLNEYLHSMSDKIYSSLIQNKEISVSPYYRPFSWMPHVTIGKTLTKEEMLIAFQTLQHQFGPFSGMIQQIGLAKTKPYQDLIRIDLKE